MTFITFDLGGHTQGMGKEYVAEPYISVVESCADAFAACYINAEMLPQHEGSGRITSLP